MLGFNFLPPQHTKLGALIGILILGIILGALAGKLAWNIIKNWIVAIFAAAAGAVAMLLILGIANM